MKFGISGSSSTDDKAPFSILSFSNALKEFDDLLNNEFPGNRRDEKAKKIRSNPLFLLLFYKDLHFVHSWQLVFLCCMRSLNKMGSYLAEQKEVIMQKKTVVE